MLQNLRIPQTILREFLFLKDNILKVQSTASVQDTAAQNVQILMRIKRFVKKEDV